MNDYCWACSSPIAPDLRGSNIRLCHQHAWEVASRYRSAILARAELDALRQQEHAVARTRAAQGNPGGDPVVYYARIGDYIKIGFSAHLRNRLRTLRVDELLAVEPGGPDLERDRHQQFTTDRIDLRRENFRPSDALLEHVAGIRIQHDLPHWAKKPRTSQISIRQKEHA